VLDELYRVAFRKKISRAIDELQADLDAWIGEYNERRLGDDAVEQALVQEDRATTPPVRPSGPRLPCRANSWAFR
jgi:hypothetical protein